MNNSKDVIAAMRKRPGMYVGNTGASGVYSLIQEVVSNSLDQYLAGHATKIYVDCTPDYISVRDDGAGLPPKGLRADFTEWFTEYRDRPSATGHAPHVHLQPIGVGLIMLNALSSRLEVETCRDGVLSAGLFSRGELVDYKTRQAENVGTGTSIRFVPDPEIFECNLPDHSFLRHKLFDAAHVVPGVKISLNQETFYSRDGLIDLARILCGHDINYPTFSTRQSTDDISIDAVALGPRLDDSNRQIYSWANGSRTDDHGSHVDGFLSAIKLGMKTGWNPSTLLINVTMQKPEFAGPTRGRLCVPEIEDRVQELVQPLFEEFTSTLSESY